MIRFSCPSCGAAQSAAEEAAGKKAKCRQCGKPFVVPRAAAAPTASPQQKTTLGQVIGHNPTALQHDSPPPASRPQTGRPRARLVRPHQRRRGNRGSAKAP
jgi:hypothetical protein